MDYNLETTVDAYWLKDKISKALAKRKRYSETHFIGLSMRRQTSSQD